MARDSTIPSSRGSWGRKRVANGALDERGAPVRMLGGMGKSSEWTGQAPQEGRAALNSLRSSTAETDDLAQALQRATEACPIPGSMAVNFSVVGDARGMHPIVRDEIFRIGYEAIRNACVHSSASKLEVELTYSQDLALRVADNGAGIDSGVAHREKHDHLGLNPAAFALFPRPSQGLISPSGKNSIKKDLFEECTSQRLIKSLNHRFQSFRGIEPQGPHTGNLSTSTRFVDSESEIVEEKFLTTLDTREERAEVPANCSSPEMG